jgi:hypothetical protein
MSKPIIFSILLSLAFVQARASDDYSSYDDIIRELRGAEVTASAPARDSGFDAIRIHAGAGFVTSRANLKTPGGLPDSASFNGAEVFMGVDLFSRYWQAEGALRSFNPEDFSKTTIALREFDLKITHRDYFSRSFFWRAGAGMTARYLSFARRLEGLENANYTTPASLFLLGVGTQLTANFSFGAEINYRAALITDTIERSAVDGNLRMTGTF